MQLNDVDGGIEYRAHVRDIGWQDYVSNGQQAGTTGQYYIEGDEEWGFPGLPAKCFTYKNGSLAVQDLINGNIDYVMVDAAPAKCITEAINEMQ